jgi:signal transduction histidine kinase
VTDFGIGIDKADQNKIFERFYRVEGRNEKTFSGFGIGLFIAKEIVERHEGKISVESITGRGSTFTFSLPAAN